MENLSIWPISFQHYICYYSQTNLSLKIPNGDTGETIFFLQIVHSSWFRIWRNLVRSASTLCFFFFFENIPVESVHWKTERKRTVCSGTRLGTRRAVKWAMGGVRRTSRAFNSHWDPLHKSHLWQPHMITSTTRNTVLTEPHVVCHLVLPCTILCCQFVIAQFWLLCVIRVRSRCLIQQFLLYRFFHRMFFHIHGICWIRVWI